MCVCGKHHCLICGNQVDCEIGELAKRRLGPAGWKILEEYREQQKKIEAVSRYLEAIIAHCGHPNAAEGCRLAISKSREALDEIYYKAN